MQKFSSKTYILVLCTTALLTYLSFSNWQLKYELKNSTYGSTTVIYSGTDRLDIAVVEQIQKAQSFVYFAIYTLTKENIVSALIAAKMRGLDVRGILDQNQVLIPEEKPWVNKLKKYGIPLIVPEKESGLMHIKMLVTDTGYVSGSFNWTTSGTSYNDEVLETGNNESVRMKYLEIFKTLEEKYSK